MVVVKVIRNTDTPEQHLKNAIGYVHHRNKENVEPLSLSGNGVDYVSPHNTYQQMMDVKQYYGKTSGNPLVHLVVSYDKKTAPDAETACQLTEKMAEYYQDKYQTIQCTHEADHETSDYHSHIVINSVGYQDGKMIHTGIDEMNQFCDYVSDTTGAKTRLEFEPTKK
ncbi:MAG: relaxase/mobilization nuclease domain-containing protein [Oscillospiraceae bacterium]|nr:relaxase/mobilization nuclease domain-containing protein [Oscillospiraceae bacterium]